MEQPTGTLAFSPATTRTAVLEGARRAGLSAGAARLVRLGSTAVFELAGDVVARVFRSSVPIEQIRRSIEVSRWLNAHGVAAVEALDVDQPVTVNGLPVTFWRSLGDGEHYGTTTDLALLFKGLHHLDPLAHIGLPPTERFAWTERRLASAHLADADRALLAERLADLRQGYDQLTFELLPGVIHDDANVGNVLVDRDGVPRLIDLDSVCVGPREWDLVLTALFYGRFGWHTRAEYEAFCRVYGFDVMAWSGYATLADVRELVMVTWMAQNAHQDDRTAAELAKRIHSIRTGSSRRDWQPF